MIKDLCFCISGPTYLQQFILLILFLRFWGKKKLTLSRESNYFRTFSGLFYDVIVQQFKSPPKVKFSHKITTKLVI